MKRIKEEFLDKLEKVVKLKNKRVLEIGCGVGTRSIQIAKRSKHLTAIEPSTKLIQEAKKTNSLENIDYQVGKAEKLKFSKGMFDAVIFTLSLHHVPPVKINNAIKEANRVVKKGGYIVFLEPTHDGNFFESEVKFDACDGDERKDKAFAYYSILSYKGYKEVAEIPDETVFQFDSYEDFIKSMNPKKNKKEIKNFLEANNYILTASRRINIFKVV
ncbi:MAG: Methyltransferase type 11 [Candidatus Nomurabacteria bacterium]|nr:Methyltransferase type 11 [Candidatus Nomurabacteria bacterium]